MRLMDDFYQGDIVNPVLGIEHLIKMLGDVDEDTRLCARRRIMLLMSKEITDKYVVNQFVCGLRRLYCFRCELEGSSLTDAVGAVAAIFMECMMDRGLKKKNGESKTERCDAIVLENIVSEFSVDSWEKAKLDTKATVSLHKRLGYLKFLADLLAEMSYARRETLFSVAWGINTRLMNSVVSVRQIMFGACI